MEEILRYLIEERKASSDTLGILAIEKNKQPITLTEKYDAVIVIIVADTMKQKKISATHYQYNKQKVALHILHDQQVQEWLMVGNTNIIDWLFYGKTLFERDQYIETLKSELINYPLFGRKIKIGLEFAELLRTYLTGKTVFMQQKYLDAYKYAVQSLYHLAKLTIIENGMQPGAYVWNKVKMIEPEIFRLYEELVTSDEPIHKKLELLFLASDFLIYSKTSIGSEHFLDVLREQRIWSFDNIIHHPSLKKYDDNISVLLEFLIEKKLIHTIEQQVSADGISQCYYKVKPIKYFL